MQMKLSKHNSEIQKGARNFKGRFLRYAIFCAICILPAYLWGVVSGYKHLFPTRQLFLLQNRLVSSGSLLSGTYLMHYVAQTKPRNTLFEAIQTQSDIVMIGDSLTQDGLWSEMFPAVKIANRGIGGDRTIDVLNRMGPILATKSKKAFILLGLNDFAYGVSVDQVFSNYIKIVQALQKNGMTVYIQSTLECSRATCGTQDDMVKALNLKLQAYAKVNKIVFIDLNKVFAPKNTGLLSKYTYDGSHLTGGGYAQWGALISPFIKQ